jgi:hypothetical protein
MPLSSNREKPAAIPQQVTPRPAIVEASTDRAVVEGRAEPGEKLANVYQVKNLPVVRERRCQGGVRLAYCNQR